MKSDFSTVRSFLAILLCRWHGAVQHVIGGAVRSYSDEEGGFRSEWIWESRTVEPARRGARDGRDVQARLDERLHAPYVSCWMLLTVGGRPIVRSATSSRVLQYVAQCLTVTSQWCELVYLHKSKVSQCVRWAAFVQFLLVGQPCCPSSL